LDVIVRVIVGTRPFNGRVCANRSANARNDDPRGAVGAAEGEETKWRSWCRRWPATGGASVGEGVGCDEYIDLKSTAGAVK
jgi:hypothetical protein